MIFLNYTNTSSVTSLLSDIDWCIPTPSPTTSAKYIGVHIPRWAAGAPFHQDLVALYPVCTDNYSKTIEYIKNSKVFYKDLPTGMPLQETIYEFVLWNNVVESDLFNVTTITAYTTPSTTYIDSGGDTVTIPGVTVPAQTVKTPKPWNTLLGLPSKCTLEIPEFYVGKATPSGILFN